MTRDYKKTEAQKEKELARRRRLRTEARSHAEEFVQLMLESTEGNSFLRGRLFGYINSVLKVFEQNGICYLKATKRDGPRIYKKYYCCHGLAVWKQCPEEYCPAFRYAWMGEIDDQMCTHPPYRAEENSPVLTGEEGS